MAPQLATGLGALSGHLCDAAAFFTKPISCLRPEDRYTTSSKAVTLNWAAVIACDGFGSLAATLDSLPKVVRRS